MPDGLTFAINPETQAASLDLFLKAVEDIRRLLRDVDYAIHRECTSRRWIISDLHSSSPTMSLRPLLGDEEMVGAIAAGIREITAGTDEPPQYFTEQVLGDLKRMRSSLVSSSGERTLTGPCSRIACRALSRPMYGLPPPPVPRMPAPMAIDSRSSSTSCHIQLAF